MARGTGLHTESEATHLAALRAGGKTSTDIDDPPVAYF